MSKFETRAIHDGQEADPQTGAVVVPVYQTSTYRQEAVGRHKGFEYSRTGNPTRKALEDALASLEGGRHGLAFSSGVAATSAVFHLLKSGDGVAAGEDLYGGTYRLLERVFAPWGLKRTYFDVGNPKALEKSLRRETRLVFIETPTNPLLKVADIRALAAVAHRKGALLAVDNTFASPYFQRPLGLGADLVVHSTTKYLAGHSDLVGGAVVTSNFDAYQALKYHQNAVGAVPGPWDAWLTLRGLKTLAVRMREHEKNATALSEFLVEHPQVERVLYPGLPGHPGHVTARRQMDGFGGMISLELKGGRKAVDRFLSRLRVFQLAESLGGVESLVCYPPGMTHGSIPKGERLKRGIRDNLVRLSVGIEHLDDLREDLASALSKV